MMIQELNDDSFLLYAIKCYESPNCIMSEFEEDMKYFIYVKRLFKKYKSCGELKERLILNHIIFIYNIFGVEGATRLLFFKTDKYDYNILKTFLLFLNCMPDVIYGINGVDIISSDISVDLSVAKILRKV